MSGLIDFFSGISTQERSLILVLGLVFLITAETLAPQVNMNYKKIRHGATNIFFTLVTLLINLIGAIFIIEAINFCQNNNFGLLNNITLPTWSRIILGLAILDLVGAWFIHWLQHSVRWMWKFHLIHHTDPNVDATTGLRHHPGENIFRLLFTILAVLISGASFGLVMMYQTVSVFFAHLTHANIKIPSGIDRYLSYIFVTPFFHKVHHHYIQPHTDSNYGNIFSIWDHMFGTAKSFYNLKNLVYGIDTHMDPKENSRLSNLLLIPFQSYRQPVESNKGQAK